MSGPTVFISYSHQDETWKDQLVRAAAHRHAARAQELVKETGYARREREVRWLEKTLAP